MLSKATDIAEKFVDLVLAEKQGDKIKEFTSEEAQIFFNIVSIAGFDPKEVKPGKLVGYYRDGDGERTGETYSINSLCPLKVIREDGDHHFFATGWLDCAFRRVVYGMERQNENREQLIEVVIKEIERSIPLSPIQITLEGDLLREYPPSTYALSGLSYFVEHSRDTDVLNTCVGIHAYCNNYMNRHGATSTCDAIVCQGCHLRVLFPKEVKTYGDLRQALAFQMIQV